MLTATFSLQERCIKFAHELWMWSAPRRRRAGVGDTAESAELARRMDALRASPAAVALRELDATVRLCPGDAYFTTRPWARSSSSARRPSSPTASRAAPRRRRRGRARRRDGVPARVSSLGGSLLAVQVSETLVLVAEADGPRRWRVEVRGGAPGVGAFLERLAGGGGGGGGAPRVVPACSGPTLCANQIFNPTSICA
ncbi:hypothetical protein JL722_14231 [Aureococcus anophagefferens]|nr:hypothetical protein JL722_14231 [Aureococcus anophagefferens]